MHHHYKNYTLTCMISIKLGLHANTLHYIFLPCKNGELSSTIHHFFPNLSLACPSCPNPTPKSPPPPKARPPPPPPPKAKPCPPPPSQTPKPKPRPPPPPTTPTSHCPIDTLKLSACVDTLSGLVHGVIGGGATHACCPALTDLTDLDAAFCLCTTIKAKVLDVKVILPIALELLVDSGKLLVDCIALEMLKIYGEVGDCETRLRWKIKRLLIGWLLTTIFKICDGERVSNLSSSLYDFL